MLHESVAMFRNIIAPAANKCGPLGERQMSLRGIYFASKPLMADEKAALRKLTSEPPFSNCSAPNQAADSPI